MVYKILVLLIFSIGLHASEITLRLYEKRLISQNGEDGILEKIFAVLGTTNKYYVEFGAGEGHFGSNTKWLREKHHWKGLLMDGFYTENPSINLHKEFVTAENICNLLKKYNVPKEFDLISIDIDRNDFYVWKALSQYYKPRVVVIECNPLFKANEDKVIRYQPDATWDGSEHTGASVLALFHLGRSLGYSLIYQESSGVNLFFVRDDVLSACNDTFENLNNVKNLSVSRSEKLQPKKVKKLFISSKEALREAL